MSSVLLARSRYRGWSVAAFASVALVLPVTAHATNPACNTLPNPTYGIGGSSQTPLVAALATALANASTPVTVIYASPAACTGVTTLLSSSTNITSTVNYWTAAGVQSTCTLPSGTGVPADFAVSGVFATSCAGVTSLPSNVNDFGGPILAWDFIVPISVTDQPSISAEAAYLVFGLGSTANVTPWTTNTDIFVRTSTSAAQIAIGAAINVPSSAFVGKSESSNSNMVSAVYGAAVEGAIGFISSDVADASRTKVTTIGYQHYGQDCGYLPDSTGSAFDKENVRDGQYFLWSASHFLTFVDSNGNPVGNSQNSDTTGTAALFDSIAGVSGAPLTPQQVLNADISTGNIPECAMNVARDSDIGALYSYQPPEPCECYFEFKATGSTSCTACTTSADCPSNAPVCRYGYCEVQ
jgi:hypothetical protein